jgi:hypothetical protein
MSEAHLLDTSTWSIWLVSLVPGILQVPLQMSFLGNHVRKTLKLLIVAYCANLRPLLFVTACRLCLPIMSLYRFPCQVWHWNHLVLW